MTTFRGSDGLRSVFRKSLLRVSDGSRNVFTCFREPFSKSFVSVYRGPSRRLPGSPRHVTDVRSVRRFLGGLRRMFLKRSVASFRGFLSVFPSEDDEILWGISTKLQKGLQGESYQIWNRKTDSQDAIRAVLGISRGNQPEGRKAFFSNSSPGNCPKLFFCSTVMNTVTEPNFGEVGGRGRGDLSCGYPRNPMRVS